MISRKKQLAYGVVLFGASGLFLQTLLEHLRGRGAPAQEDGPALAVASSGFQAEPSADPAAPPEVAEPSGEVAAPAETRPGSGDPLVRSMEEVLERMAQLAAAPEPGAPSRALATGGEEEAPPAPPRTAGTGAASLGEPAQTEAQPLGARERAQRFLARHPLEGLVAGSRGGVALIGGRLCHAGCDLGEGIALAAVTAQGIVLAVEGVEVAVSLPPVRASARAGAAPPAGEPAEPAPDRP